MENKSLLVYAYLGDAVYELLTREYLCFKTGAKAKVNDLKNESLSFVSATSQATILKKLLDLDFFNEQELDLLRRGRNVKTNSKPTNPNNIWNGFNKKTAFQSSSSAN